MPDGSHNNALDLISEILGKMIDMQQASTEAMTGLKSSVEESGRTVHEINTHFKNGFRSELKGHMTQEVEKIKTHYEEARKQLETHSDETKAQLEELNRRVFEFNEILSKPSYWMKLILATIAATATAIGATVALIMRFMG